MNKNRVNVSLTAATMFADSKPHYALLDALRGVAALLVVFYHIFEGFSFAGGGVITTINHGYLAVDFFFMLSGFVLAYAYDDRWKTTLTTAGFIRRRLIRLHPMIVIGAIIGMITFIIQGRVQWDGTTVAFGAIIVALIAGMCLIPAIPGGYYEVRGAGEMYPLNGPSWSLFFEYVGNLVYALFLRRLSDKMLLGVVVLTGICFGWFAIADVSGYGMIGVGWTLDGMNFIGGFLRMIFPMSFGMLLSRKFRPVRVKGAFWICTLTLIVLFCVPFLNKWNGVYEFCCIALIFPMLVWLGASASESKAMPRFYKLLGDISYPLYAIHYPLMYLFFSWLLEAEQHAPGETWAVAIVTYMGSVLLAYICLKCYDIPVRKRLSRIFIRKE